MAYEQPDRCPCCRRPFRPAAASLAKYATREARLAAVRQKRLERQLAKMKQDVATVWPHVPEWFISSDVGRACWKAGRHWSAHQGVLGRAIRLGLVVQAGVVHKGLVEVRLFHQRGMVQTVHVNAKKVCRRTKKGLTRKR